MVVKSKRMTVIDGTKQITNDNTSDCVVIVRFKRVADDVDVLWISQKLLDICDTTALTDCLVMLIETRHARKEW